LQYQDSVVELRNADKNDTEEGSFRADFFIMSGLLTKMFQEFLKIFAKTSDKKM
jgi:DNA recombination-dependent growth factor C